jgi:hypothetical protein
MLEAQLAKQVKVCFPLASLFYFILSATTQENIIDIVGLSRPPVAIELTLVALSSFRSWVQLYLVSRRILYSISLI